MDYFALFGLPCRFAVDREALDRRYRELQAQVHPDRHASATGADRRAAMEAATQVNEAYRTLSQPLLRGRYLMSLKGHEVALENNNAMPPEFLMGQLELREDVAEARESGDLDRLDSLRGGLKRGMDAEVAELGDALDRHDDLARAERILLQLLFQDKLLHEIDDAIEAIEA